MTAATSVEGLLQVTATAARRLSGVAAVSIMPQHALQPDLYPRTDEVHAAAWIARASAISSVAMRETRTVIATDCALEPLTPAALRQIRGITAVPVGTPIVAAVAFYWSHAHAPSGAELQTLETIARMAGCAWHGLNAAEELQQSNRRCRALTAQQQHKVRNVLAMVRSIVRRSAATSASPEEFSEHLGGRIDAIARAQSFLVNSADGAVDLYELIMGELVPTAVREEQLHIEGPSLRLQGKGAESMTLAVHELATNAVKFGALGRTRGHLSVTWRVDERHYPAHLQLQWLEEGSAPADIAPRQRGFGHEMIELALPYELNGHTDIQLTPGGLRCCIDIPLVDSICAGSSENRALGSDNHDS